eukprot:TRINITY_DN6978_c0_g1_i3.p1 TRINITY_DN6978_c0_g1~~TRINITY_DN6978_c0_g1_i3.p1  ORF type:complete len:193 (+),score=16.18 TRINITY_DN6978_c0_g1_i3:330-908(+)
MNFKVQLHVLYLFRFARGAKSPLSGCALNATTLLRRETQTQTGFICTTIMCFTEWISPLCAAAVAALRAEAPHRVCPYGPHCADHNEMWIRLKKLGRKHTLSWEMWRFFEALILYYEFDLNEPVTYAKIKGLDSRSRCFAAVPDALVAAFLEAVRQMRLQEEHKGFASKLAGLFRDWSHDGVTTEAERTRLL